MSTNHCIISITNDNGFSRYKLKHGITLSIKDTTTPLKLGFGSLLSRLKYATGFSDQKVVMIRNNNNKSVCLVHKDIARIGIRKERCYHHSLPLLEIDSLFHDIILNDPQGIHQLNDYLSKTKINDPQSPCLTLPQTFTLLARKHRQKFHTLLGNGNINLNQHCQAGYSTFDYACRVWNYFEDVVETMLDHGANPNQENKVDRFLPIHIAAQRGQHDLISTLGKYRITNMNKMTKKKHSGDLEVTAMSIAVLVGSTNALSALCYYGASPNVGSNIKTRPIYLAYLFNKLRCANLLHTAGSAIDGCRSFRYKFRIEGRFRLIDQDCLLRDFYTLIIDKTVSDSNITEALMQYNLINMSGFNGITAADMLAKYRSDIYEQFKNNESMNMYQKQ
jgi:ankyrin repeat protein